MNKNKLTEWSKNWKRNLLEVFVACGILASACTTFAGAYFLVNHSLIVAGLFTGMFQGGLYVIGHYASATEHERQHRRTFALFLVWIVLAFFSIWASSLGMFALQQESLRSDLARAGIFKQWTDGAKNIAEFKTRSLAEIYQAKQTTSLDINAERSRIRAARAERRAYSNDTLQSLSSDLAALQSAETRLRQLRPLSITPPENSETASHALDDAFSATGETYASIPERLRSRISQPRPGDQVEMSSNIQKAFVEGLRSRSVPVLLMLVFSVMLDLLAPLVLFATAPKKTLDERIVAFRQWKKALDSARRVPLAAETERVRVTVRDAPQLDIHISVPTAHGGPLVDIDTDFAEVTAEVRRGKDPEMQLESVKTGSGKPLVDGLPLLKQLGQDRELVLQYVLVHDSYTGEVN
jgi:hypothetical protein